MKKNDLEALKSCRLLEAADDALFTELLSSGNYLISSFSRGEKIFSPENAPASLAIILKGTAEVSKDTGRGTLYMSSLTKGKMSGMSCLFGDGTPFPTTVTAKDSMRILFIEKQQLMSLFSRYPEILERYLSLLSTKICFLNEKIESISAPDTTEALRNYLLDISAKLEKSTFSLPVPVQKLASTLSVGRTSLYRAFDQLTEEGFLTKNGREITINERTNAK